MNAKNEALVPQEGEVVVDTKNASITVRDGTLGYEDFAGLWRLSKIMVLSGYTPKVKDGTSLEERMAQVAVSIARGRSVGLDAFQSVESIVPINGRPMIWGNAPLAICRQHPQWLEKGFDEYWEVKGQRQDSHPAKFDDDSITAVCETLREGAQKPLVRKFSVADAKRAGLWGQSGKLYGSYPQRMLPARARAYNLNDNFGDALKGIAIRETFDEEVDGKPPVTNGEELRTEIDKRKKQETPKELFERGRKMAVESESPKIANNSSTIKEAMKQSFPDALEGKQPGDRVSFNDALYSGENPPSELDIARDLLKGAYNLIPLKQNPIECLKKASMEDGTWIGFEHIESISDLDYLKRITSRLEELAVSEVRA